MAACTERRANHLRAALPEAAWQRRLPGQRLDNRIGTVSEMLERTSIADRFCQPPSVEGASDAPALAQAEER